MKEVDLKPCPFCGHVPEDLRDALHPSGIRWREDRGQRHYIGHKDPRDGERCWEMNCLEHEGGCGANITADSREEVVAKWNSRALDVVTLTGEEYDTLRKDAERYRWLRDNAGAWEVSRDLGEWTKCDTGEKYHPRVYFSAHGTGYGGMKLDDAIRAAMSRTYT